MFRKFIIVSLISKANLIIQSFYVNYCIQFSFQVLIKYPIPFEKIIDVASAFHVKEPYFSMNTLSLIPNKLF